MVCDHYKIPTAPFALIPPRVQWPDSGFDPISALMDATHAEALRSFPLFVKPATISTGIGIDQANKVKNRQELVVKVEELSKKHPRDSLLIERFLAGREFTVGIIGSGPNAQVGGIRELIYIADGGPPPNTTAEIKENDALYNQDVYGLKSKFSRREGKFNPWPKDMDLDDPMCKKVAKVALDAWRVLECQDAGRVDIRNDTKDPLEAIPNFIEVGH